MLDLFLSEKILNHVMQNPRCSNKFLGFFWRAALVFGGILAAIFVLIYLFFGKNLPVQFVVILVGIVVLVGLVMPIVHWFLLK